MSNKELDNDVCIVTGATGLLGKEHCRALANAGAIVIACDINLESAQSFVETLGANHRAYYLDVTDAASVVRVREEVWEEFGKIDVLVNNAAINDSVEHADGQVDASALELFPLATFRKVMDVNVAGVLLCTQVFGTVMANHGGGSIINIGSTYGVVAPNQSLYQTPTGEQSFFKGVAYPVSKGAVVQLTRYCAAFWGNKHVRVNTLSPGGVENNQPEHFIQEYSKRTPLGRMAHASDYHSALVFLASKRSSYVTAHNLVVDGGFTCW
jgi:NAD(P)-dependent dehydrogenase (short-subunit alcohol dehydrogenase family)